MPSIVKKTKQGKAYYYAVQSGRVKGKPRIVWQKYLGSVEAILKQYEQTTSPRPTETVLFEAGGVAVLLKIASRLGLIDLINEIVPKRDQGPSVGHYIVLAALNRALDPLSKSQIGEWYHGTSLQRVWRFPVDAFTSQRYWDHMGMLSEDALDKIQNFLVLRLKEEFHIEARAMLYDTTNFFTYIDTHNARCALAQRGKNKQKRTDLRQVNLALLTTQQFQIPLLHKTYEGESPDVKFFPNMIRDLLTKHRLILGASNDVTLVFDKGNLSERTQEQLLHSGTYFVAGLKSEVFPEILTLPFDKFADALKLPGTKFYEEVVEVEGKSCKVVVSYSESFFTEQLAALTGIMTKCQDQLKRLQTELLMWAEEKKPKGRRPTKALVKQRLKEILAPQYMNNLFTVSVVDGGNTPFLKYAFNRAEFDKLIATRLGRTLLITNRVSWLPTEVISTYRAQAHIENAFKNMKNRDYLRWQPAFHWTDQKIRVHTLYCVLALLLTSLARKMAWEAGVELSIPALLDELSSMKEIALLYPDKTGKLKAYLTMNKMSPRQKKLADLFEIAEILAAG